MQWRNQRNASLKLIWDKKQKKQRSIREKQNSSKNQPKPKRSHEPNKIPTPTEGQNLQPQPDPGKTILQKHIEQHVNKMKQTEFDLQDAASSAMETGQVFIKTAEVETPQILVALTGGPAPSRTEPPETTFRRKNDPAFYETDEKANKEKQTAKTHETPQTSHAPNEHEGRERGTGENLPRKPWANSRKKQRRRDLGSGVSGLQALATKWDKEDTWGEYKITKLRQTLTRPRGRPSR